MSSYVIDSTSGLSVQYLRELWASRDLAFNLLYRDLKARYAQTAVGPAWAIIQPVMSTVVFSVIFGELARLPSDGLPYPVFALSALLAWNLFSGALSRSGTSLVGRASLIQKVYFPRMVVPITATLSGLPDFAIGVLILLGMMLYYGFVPSARILALPLFILIALVSGMSLGLWFAVAHVRFRDVGFFLPYVSQVAFYATPVAYSASLVPERWRALYWLNPMTGVVEGFRWALLGAEGFDFGRMALSLVVVAVLLVAGTFFFVKMETSIMDVA